MASFEIKHQFVSPKPNGSETDLIRPSDWNAEHEFILTGSGAVARLGQGTGSAEFVPFGTGANEIPLNSHLGSAAYATLGSAVGDALEIISAGDPAGPALPELWGGLLTGVATLGEDGKIKPEFLPEPGEEGGSGLDVQVFTSSGTWTKPAGLKQVRVIVVGGGGGGGRWINSTNGAGGGTSFALIDADDLGSTETVTVGGGGNAGASNGDDGGAGGSSSFGSHVSATGGQGGSAGTTTTNRIPGAGTGGYLNLSGQASVLNTDGLGNSIFGFSGFVSPFVSNQNPLPGTGYGSGGARAKSNDASGATNSTTEALPGRPGIVIVEEYFQ